MGRLSAERRQRDCMQGLLWRRTREVAPSVRPQRCVAAVLSASSFPSSLRTPPQSSWTCPCRRASASRYC
ncbi:hypothetical protein C8T65DRAFT_659250 [Cerioporus squamosus]|nr:hypothetical protein C8T65DRAFT_659250 [Cerioporus squamosus]